MYKIQKIAKKLKYDNPDSSLRSKRGSKKRAIARITIILASYECAVVWDIPNPVKISGKKFDIVIMYMVVPPNVNNIKITWSN